MALNSHLSPTSTGNQPQGFPLQAPPTPSKKQNALTLGSPVQVRKNKRMSRFLSGTVRVINYELFCMAIYHYYYCINPYNNNIIVNINPCAC